MSSGRAILHIDMDAFYASVEQRDDPSLRGKPVLVGGPMRRGVVSAASYEARKFGARSAMPMAEALRRCPQAIVVPARIGKYAAVSAQVFAIFKRYTPLVEGLSLDEAFLDVTASRSLFGDGAAIARRIKDAIREELSLTASAGVAPVKFAAKIASDLQKPDGLVVVPEAVAPFLAPLPIERMWGVGPKAAAKLHDAGLRSIGDLASASYGRLVGLLGEALATHVQTLAQGDDPREVVPGRAAVSVGAEETFDNDIGDPERLARKLLELSDRVARRLFDAGYAGRVVMVKVKYPDFTLKTRRATLEQPISDVDSIYEAAREQLERLGLRGRRVRLLGVAVAELTAGGEGRTLALFPDEKLDRRRRLQEVVANVEDRFGKAGITRASLAADPASPGAAMRLASSRHLRDPSRKTPPDR
ncbi:MAG: DNA polymerase IV [Polyangiaceae bacterium]